MAIDQGKVAVVKQCFLPTSVKELQWFFRFANFYLHFIHSFSTVALS